MRLLLSNSGWDVHDAGYSRELLISNKANGYRDVIAEIDLSTYRRISLEDNVPFFLVSFLDPETRKPLSVCPRGVVSLVVKMAEARGWTPMAGCEYEVRILPFGSHSRY
jgi:glutamine synthetase